MQPAGVDTKAVSGSSATVLTDPGMHCWFPAACFAAAPAPAAASHNHLSPICASCCRVEGHVSYPKL